MNRIESDDVTLPPIKYTREKQHTRTEIPPAPAPAPPPPPRPRPPTPPSQAGRAASGWPRRGRPARRRSPARRRPRGHPGPIGLCVRMCWDGGWACSCTYMAWAYSTPLLTAGTAATTRPTCRCIQSSLPARSACSASTPRPQMTVRTRTSRSRSGGGVAAAAAARRRCCWGRAMLACSPACLCEN